jgi:hypothetical protein
VIAVALSWIDEAKAREPVYEPDVAVLSNRCGLVSGV